MSEQDDTEPNADVIEQAPQWFRLPALPAPPGLRAIIGTRRRRLAVVAAACALLAVAATLTTFRLTQGPPSDPALAGLIREVTTVPMGDSVPGLPGSASPPGAYSSTLTETGLLQPVSGPALTHGGKPEVLYVGTEFCPYCAIENWPLIVALSRFGQFTGLATSQSPEFEHIAPINSWTFYGTRYSSSYLSFTPVEQYSSVLLNPSANPDTRESYRELQPLTPAQQAIMTKYDHGGFTPFLDFGNRAVQVGSGPIPTQLMTGKSWPQLAAALRQPQTALGAALLDEADSLTGELCRLTGARPASACPAFIQSFQQPS